MTAQRPQSTLSDCSATSSAGASTTSVRRPGTSQRQRPTPIGPRKPTVKPSLSTVLSQAQHQQQQQPQQPQQHQEHQQHNQQQHERHQQNRQSKNEQPPSYVQSQNDLHTQRPLQNYTPPPTSAVTSDSSCSHAPMSVFTRADTPSSMSAFSPVRTMSPAPVLEPHAEEPSAHPAPRQPSLALSSAHSSNPDPVSHSHSQPNRISTPSLPSISKPPTPVSDSPGSTLVYSRPRMANSLPTPAPLQPPPSVDFSPVPIAWKALMLDAAQWTFSSAELQAIVSRAIRASAEPSSIRLLPLQTLDEDLAQEVDRLESERAQATAQYRFTMHRRTMLLQSLNASSSPSTTISFSSSNTINLSQAPLQSPAADLAQRLAEVSATLDRLAVKLVQVSDQLAQIRSLQDVHAASALAVALRKLNASYARRTREAQSLKEKLATTEEERDEAWRVAEELAMEFDGEEEFDEADVVNGERAVVGTATFTRASRISIKLKVPGVGPRVRHPESANDVPEDGVGDPNAADSPSSAPGESIEPATTPIQRRRRANSATSRVTAARTRSVRASKASLRFPRRQQQQDSRPPSAYSQHSAHGGGRGRSRSRGGSIAGSPLDAPSPNSSSPSGGAVIPDVPKIPNVSELSRLANVKSTASVPSALHPMPPMPPPPIETSPSAIRSFLDLMTRPNSASDETRKSPEKVVMENTGAGMDESVQDQKGEASLNAEDGDGYAQANSGMEADGDLQRAEVDGEPLNDNEDADEAPIITLPVRPPLPRTPLSASLIDTTPHTAEIANAKKQLAARPSLHVYPPKWTRPPPDSPMDVSHRSNPHRADNGDELDEEEEEEEEGMRTEDEEEAELADAFESAYVRTQMQGRGALVYARSPLRTQHAQSMLPFPVPGSASGSVSKGPGPPEVRVPFLSVHAHGESEGMGAMRRSPASENEVMRFRGAAVRENGWRPASLPSAQGDKPWTYF